MEITDFIESIYLFNLNAILIKFSSKKRKDHNIDNLNNMNRVMRKSAFDF